MTTFEDRLLGELRQVVAMTPAPARPGPARRRLVLAGATATAAVAATVGLATGGDAAYAVDKADDGSVTVTVKELSDPGGLERELRAAGVPADVVVRVPCSAPGVGPEKVTRPFPGGAGEVQRATVPGEDAVFRIAPEDVGKDVTIAAAPGDVSSLTVAVGQAPPPAC